MAVDCKLNIIVLGESGVGKTSLLVRYTKQAFKEFQISTIIDCLHKVINIEGKEIKLDLWDTAGQDRYRTLTKSYYRMADGVFLIYDVGNILTFNRLTSWLQELRDINENAVTLIVGNKTDILNRRAVTLNAVQSYAQEEKLPFMEASAKSGENVDMVFDSLVREILIRKGIITGSSVLFNTDEKSITESLTNCNQQELSDTSLTKTANNDIIQASPKIIDVTNDIQKLSLDFKPQRTKCC